MHVVACRLHCCQDDRCWWRAERQAMAPVVCRITGTVPDGWADARAFVKLETLDLHVSGHSSSVRR